MRKTVILVSLALFISLPTWVHTQCFLVHEHQRAIYKEGDCSARHAPCSTFKIVLSLIGYNEGLLLNETHPEWPFQEGYLDDLERWKQAHTPLMWMKNSCVWYSQVLAQKLGIARFKEYIEEMNYGNRDVSGDKGQDNGLTRSWLSSSLKISPEEQVFFAKAS